MADSALFPCAATLGMRVALETFTKAPAAKVTALRRTIKPARTGRNSPSTESVSLTSSKSKQGCNPWFPPLSARLAPTESRTLNVTIQPGGPAAEAGTCLYVDYTQMRTSGQFHPPPSQGVHDQLY
jgi:hypothetical protein